MSRIPIHEARSALTAARKPAVGVPAYLRWINRPLGGRVAIVAASWGATPNMVTAVSALLGFVGIGILIAVPEAWAGPAATVLLLACYVFDSADGQLARIQRRGGPAGEWLDHVVDAVRAPLVHIAIAVHLVRTHLEGGRFEVAQPVTAVVIVAAAFSALVSAWFLSQILAEKLAPPEKPDAERGRRGIMESFVKQPQDSSTTYVIVALIGLPVVFGVAYVALFAWQLMIFAVSLRRKYSKLRSL
ncbi:CDP-alcohol phosphatidyltransferase family protein [Microbacterium sp. 179-I 3D3 NHS]|uniref:CDP-alcohol phosphatidyltransferase family protein n=1 Tax=Microbacterium sp. 179-I 3D3 NHS TaxID=3142382 RepID=UPI0039A266D8